MPARMLADDSAYAETNKLSAFTDSMDGNHPAETMNTPTVPAPWIKWCSTGRHGVGNRKKNAVIKCLKNGHVRGYFSDIPLRPDLDTSHSMYPSFDHLIDPTNHKEAVVEARIINDMKSHLCEDEFWRVVEHLFIVGVEKRKIKPPYGKRLPKGWSPKKHYTRKEKDLIPPPINNLITSAQDDSPRKLP